MSAWVRNLLILLVIQLLLLAVLQFRGGAESEQATPLSMASASAVASVEIVDGDDNTVTLAKSGQADWQLASGLPADADKISALLDKLTGFELGWPVTTGSEAHDRFEVASDNFQRRVSLTGEGVDETLWFGTSPGYQQVHARGDGDSVYAVKLANYDMPTGNDDWLDKTLLQGVGEPSAVSWQGGPEVTRSADGWLLNGELANIEATRAAVQRVAELTVLGVLDSAPGAAPADARTILVTDDEGDYRLSFWPRESNNDHVVMSTRYPDEAFRLANYVAEALVPEAGSLIPPKVPTVELPVSDSSSTTATTAAEDEAITDTVTSDAVQ